METKTMKHFAKTLAKDMIRRDMKKWPPDCLALSYQPLRPAKSNSQFDEPKMKAEEEKI